MQYGKRCLTLLLLGAVCSFNAQAQSTDAQSSDERLRDGIVGIWFSHFNWTDPNKSDSWIEAHGRDEYFADGTMQGITKSTTADGTSRLEFRAKWRIEQGVLIVEVLKAKGGFLRAGMVTRDKILSLNDSTLELLADDGNRLVLNREQ